MAIVAVEHRYRGAFRAVEFLALPECALRDPRAAYNQGVIGSPEGADELLARADLMHAITREIKGRGLT